ncbi:MAG: TRAP transporter small permease [Phaeodactylibacter sp.]|nr:TRAP transporter small permease [Phaeodactylibacter sp.]
MRQKIDKILGNFLAILMGIMTIDVLWGVFTRYAMGSQASWTEELARFLLIWIGILGAAYAAGKDMHLAIDLLMPRLKEEGQKRLKILISFLIVLFAFTVMVIGGIRLIYITHVLGQLSPALRVPMAVIYSVVPLSGILVVYYKANNIILQLKKND